MDKVVFIKTKTKYHDCVELEGLEYIDAFEKKKLSLFLGIEISDYKEIKELPESAKKIENDALLTVYDLEGIKYIYENTIDKYIIHCVSSKEVYRDDKGFEYRKMSLDQYAKFRYLFSKSNRLFYPTF